MQGLWLFHGDPNVARLAEIARLFGAECEIGGALPREAVCVVLRGRDYETMRTQLDGTSHAVLVYDILSSAALTHQLGAECLRVRSCQISSAAKEIAGALAGLEAELACECTVFGRAEGFTPLISVGDRPFFMRKDRYFFVGAGAVTDLGSPAKRGCEPARDFFAELMPFAMFIKWALKDRCWRAAEPCASIVIDDPLLRPRYGCIEFESFLKWLHEDDLAATFAFIPWNHARSNPKTVKLFQDNPDTLSICVHGCDHTKGEFRVRDPARLDAIAQTAMARMAKHEERFGLRHDRVMVFPQGKFSIEALASLKRSGYVAAVNTSPFPTNYTGEFTLRDLLDLAVTTPDGVPLFRRRYPVDLFGFACDLFFERPAIIVQHHQDFCDGFESLQAFIQKLRAIKPDLRWMPIGSLLARSHWQKRTDDGTAVSRKLVGEPASSGPWPEMDYPLTDRAKIAYRRYLSEFRDNYIHPSAMLSAAAATVRR